MLALFRTDCDAGQGMGHIMRCAALARALRSMDVDVVFACSKPEGVAFAYDSGFEVLDLSSVDMEAEKRFLLEYGYSRDVSLIVADSYEYEPAYLRALGAIAPVVYIDDLHTPGLAVKAIINGNITADEVQYKDLYVSGDTKLLIGTQFSLLRSEFCGLGSFSAKDDVRKILVASGGSDPHYASVKVTEALLNCPSLSECEIVVMVGVLSGSIDWLHAISACQSRVKVRQGVRDVAQLMRSCDMAVAAAGGTMNELCACGVPSIAYALAENQVKAVAAFVSANCALEGGAVWEDGFSSLVARCAEALANDASLRTELSKNAKRLFDGKGAERLARELYGFMATGSWET